MPVLIAGIVVVATYVPRSSKVIMHGDVAIDEFYGMARGEE